MAVDRLRILLCAAAGAATLGGCEEHRSPAIKGAPEILHQALSGDADAQASLATCYAASGTCFGVAPDPPMACAWRGVRLASWRPDLSLADSERFRADCASPEQTFGQRASIALSDWTARIYRRQIGDVAQMSAALAKEEVLYPAIETARTRINRELARTGAGEQLAPFGEPKPSADASRLNWSACGKAVCLEGMTPSFGGGIIAYRVTVRSATARASALAASLAAAALEAPSAADLVQRSATPSFAVGPVCWLRGQGEPAGAYVGAQRAPCAADAGF